MVNYYGKIFLRNCNISYYKKKQAAWQNVERATERRELFEDILGEKAPVRSKCDHGGMNIEKKKI